MKVDTLYTRNLIQIVDITTLMLLATQFNIFSLLD